MGERGDKPGLASALQRTGPGAPPAARAEQLSFADLLEPPVRSNASRTAAAQIREKRGPGRPAGAGNKRTQEWCDFLDARYTSPVECLSAVATMSPRELLVELELWSPDPDDATAKPPADLITWAFERIQWSQKEAAPYRHAKLGNVVQDDDGNDIPVFAIGALVRPGGGLPGDRAQRVGGSVIDMRPADERNKQYQEVSDGECEASNAALSNEDAKPLNEQGEQGE